MNVKCQDLMTAVLRDRHPNVFVSTCLASEGRNVYNKKRYCGRKSKALV